MQPFSERLAAAVRRCGNPVVVGLDPRWEQLPKNLLGPTDEQGHSPGHRALLYQYFCLGVIDVVSSLVPAVKPQAAFFEQLGHWGIEALRNVIGHAMRKGLLVILDAKRGDIGSTAEAYAGAYLDPTAEGALHADALTVNPYLGGDTLEPFVKTAHAHDGGLFVLVKTSNPGSAQFQDLEVAKDRRPVYCHVADHVQKLASADAGPSGYGSVGAVVGATYPEQLAELRGIMPQAWLLIPGYGSQGATARDVAAGFDAHGLGAIVNNSRGIIFAQSRPEYARRFPPDRWQDAVAAATRDMIDQLRADTPAGRLKP